MKTTPTMTEVAIACAMCPRVMVSTSCDSVLRSLCTMCHKIRNARVASPGRTPGLRRGFSVNQSVRFGGTFRFDIATGRLWSGDVEVRLTPKAAAVLKELVTHAGTPVSKEHLFATVWDGVAVSDDALTSCVQ